MSMKDLLNTLTTEAAIADMPLEGPNEHLEEALLDGGSAGEPNVAQLAEDAQRSNDLGDHLNEIGDRAEKLEVQAENTESPIDERVLDASVEGLHREYNTTIRAYGVAKPWHSYSTEAATTSKQRLGTLKADSRKFAAVAKKGSAMLADESFEAAGLTKAIMRHKARLASAHAALQSAARRFEAKAGELAEHPFTIRNNGLARFLMRENMEVTNLPAAIAAEAAWLNKAHTAIQAAFSTLRSGIAHLKANPNSSFDHGAEFRVLRELTTSKGFLMGNHTAEIKKDSPMVPFYVRTQSGKAGTFGSRAAGTVAGIAGFAGGAQVATPVMLAIGGPGIGALAATIGITTAAAKTASGFVKDRSKVTSIATAADLKKVIGEVLGYEKYTTFSGGIDFNVFNELDDLSDHKPVFKQLHEALWNLHVLAEVVYDQAFYTTTHMASLVDNIR